MKFEFSKAWCNRIAQLEGDAEIVAGVHAKTPHFPSEQSTVISMGTSLVFGKLIQLLRRDKKLSAEKLAAGADISLDDLNKIERDPLFRPDPRSVYMLAEFFDIPKKKLQQLSGLTAANDSHLQEEALRFAASANPAADLSREEKSALKAFISVLNEE